jgi:lipopolysaccharide biosynthesis glycosyltransferase/thioredoxin-like negative regulator of GroEL
MKGKVANGGPEGGDNVTPIKDESRATLTDMPTPDLGKVAEGHSGHTTPFELVRLGLSARQGGDLPGAVRLFEAASTAAPENLNILVELANTLREMSRLSEAEAIYHRAIEREEGHFGALVGLGHVARLRDDRCGALAHFEAARRTDPRNLSLHVEIGNTLRELHRLEDAEAVYRHVLEQAPKQAGAMIGLGHIAKGRGEWPAALAQFEAAAALLPENPNIQWEVAHTLREMDRLDEAEAHCRRLLEGVPTHIGALILLGSASRQRQDHVGALKYFETAAGIDTSNSDIRVEVAHTLREMDRLEEAEVVYRGVLEHRPDAIAALMGLGHLDRMRGEWPAALARFEAAASAWPQNLNVQLAVAGTLLDISRLEEAEASYLRILDQAPHHAAALLGLGRVASQRGDWAAALARFEEAAAASPDSPKPQFEIMVALRELLRLDEAEAILRRLEEAPQAKTDSEFQIRILEHYCTTLQLDKAAERVLSWGGHRNVPSRAIALTAGLYAARGQWREVLDFFRVRVVESGASPRMAHHQVLLEALARAARTTGRYVEVLNLVNRLLAGGAHPDIQRVRDQLIEEARLLRSLDLLSDDDPGGDLAIGSPLQAWRADLLSQLLVPARQTKPNRTVYLCTDRNYLPGAMVAMSSLLRHNMGSLRNYSILIFCSDEILDFASVAFGRLAAAFSVRIDLRPSTSLFADGSKLRTGWGIFTPGHALSEAAYYRIYAVLQLLKEGVQGRALYVDSDTCICPHLDKLLEFDLERQPLGARLENPTLVDIRRAAMRLGIRPEAYFNSGVLLFDLAHPKLASALHHAIEISLTQKHRLTFVDQCALNLAFHEMVATLPEPFNMYVRQNTEPEALTTDPVVRHFLQRPKPWDPMYQSANCTPWFEEFAALGQILDTGLLRRLFALQFPVRPTRVIMGSLG